VGDSGDVLKGTHRTFNALKGTLKTASHVPKTPLRGHTQRAQPVKRPRPQCGFAREAGFARPALRVGGPREEHRWIEVQRPERGIQGIAVLRRRTKPATALATGRWAGAPIGDGGLASLAGSRAGGFVGVYARRVEWALPEWTVLAVVRERPAHGFAIAALTARGGELGRVWQIPRPVIYRALSRLEAAGLVAPKDVESGAGPPRTVYAITEAGRAAADEWLARPVAHVRELRSHLLMKLALLDRRGLPVASLIAEQRAVLLPVLAAVAAERERAAGFEAVLLSWRHGNVEAALRFLDEIG